MSWEVESSRLDNVSSGGKHGNASVLDFSGTEPLEGLFTSPIGKIKGVETLDWKGVSWQTVEAGADLSASTLLKK